MSSGMVPVGSVRVSWPEGEVERRPKRRKLSEERPRRLAMGVSL